MALKHANSGMRVVLLRREGDALQKTPSMVVESDCEDGMLVIRPSFDRERSVSGSAVEELQCGNEN